MNAVWSRRGAVLLVAGAVGGIASLACQATAQSPARPAERAIMSEVPTVSATLQPTSTPVPAPTATPVPATPTPRPEAPSGRLLFTHNGSIWQWSPSGHQQVTTDAVALQPAWSPDYERIAFVGVGRGFSDLLVMEPATGQVRRLTQNRGAVVQRGTWAYRPAWSPDGDTIAFVSDAASYHLALWLISPSGTNRRQISRWADGRGGIDAPSWAADGTRLAVASYPEDGPGQLFVVDVRTSRITQLTALSATVYDPCFSPDGQSIAFATLDESGSRIWLAAADGGQAVPAAEGERCRNPVWSPDGNWLAFIAGTRNDHYGVYAVRTDRDGTQRQPIALSGSLQVAAGGGLSWGA